MHDGFSQEELGRSPERWTRAAARKTNEKHRKEDAALRELWEPGRPPTAIRYDERLMARAAERDNLQTREEQEVDRLFLRSKDKYYEPVRSRFRPREELENLLQEMRRDGLKLLAFIGLGFNRAAFLAKKKDGTRVVVKIAMRERGNADNGQEAYVYEEARESGDGGYFVQTDRGSNRDEWILQEFCRPAPITSLPQNEQRAIYAIEDRYRLTDAQGGYSLRDGKYKLFDFAL